MNGEAIAIEIAQGLKAEQFEFTVDVNGTKYDVYWFERGGKVGQIAFAIIKGKAVIAYVGVGRQAAQVVEFKIAAGEAKH